MNKKTKEKRERNMAVYTAECERAFVVSPEKSEKFFKDTQKAMNQKPKNNDLLLKIMKKVTTDEKK